MEQNMIDMNMGGFMLNGTWQNQSTGKVTVINDQYMDESGNVYATTTDGRTFGYNQLQDYLQLSDQTLSNQEIHNIETEWEALHTDAQNDQSQQQDLGNIFDQPFGAMAGEGGLSLRTNEPNTQSPQQSQNYTIIDKAFKGKVDAPDVELVWPKIPARQISFLTEMMDIPLDDIAEYIYNEYINNKEIMIGKISDSIKSTIEL